MDSTESLQQELDASRAAREVALDRLKAAAAKASNGASTPITDRFREGPEEALSESSDDALTPAARIERCRKRVDAARARRADGVVSLKRTALSVVRAVTPVHGHPIQPPPQPGGNGAG